MRFLVRTPYLIVLNFFCAVSLAQAQNFTPPPFRAPIVDQANIISESLERQLSAALDRIWKSGGSQVAVLTLTDLGGVPIETASIKTVEQWKLGDAKKDNGVLLIISKNDRALRIEVGQGLEGELSDLYAKRIVDDVIVPRFKSGEFEAGLVEGLNSIFKYTDPKVDFLNGVDARQVSNPRRSFGRGLIGALIMLFFQHPVIFFFLVAVFASGFRRRRGPWGGGGTGGFGGGGFGGGFGGGGFGGGGGGGFSGGGASGRW